jgi:hypothetical protein
MRHAGSALAVALAIVLPAATAQAARTSAAQAEFHSRAAVIAWTEGYRHSPEPARLPAAVRALSEAGALREPEAAGFMVGFVAGVLGAHPAQAERLIERMLPLPPSDQWLVVRAVAYSGLPTWKTILAKFTARLPARRAMIDDYLTGRLPTLAAIRLDQSPTFLEQLRLQFGGKPEVSSPSFSNNPELLDTLWGVYFATGRYRPVWRILTVLPWSKDRDSVARLATGSAAKYTLASNAARYPDLMALLRDMAPYQAADVRPVLAEALAAAERMQAGDIRKAQVAAIEELKRKGPGYRRDMKLWGYVGQGAIALGCIAAATLSLTTLGLPCVIGGALSSAAINYMAAE